MSQVIVVRCDNPAHGDLPPECETNVYLIPPMTAPRELDACTECNETLTLAAMRDIVIEHGRKPSIGYAINNRKRPDADHLFAAPARGPAKERAPLENRVYPCLLCDRAPVTTAGLVGHYQQAHRLPPTWKSTTCGVTRCPLCGDRKKSSTGVGVHVSNAHGVRTLCQALVDARDGSDEFGVAAEAVAYLKSHGAMP